MERVQLTPRRTNSGLGGWPDPKPLETRLLPVEPFSDDLLPDSLRPLVLDVAERMQVSLDFPGITIVTSLAGAVGRRCTIQPKEHDTSWIVVPNLWGAVIGSSGYMKSPLIQAITKPLANIESLLQKQTALTRKEYRSDHAQWKASKGHPEDEPSPPIERRIIVNDATFEKLQEIMRVNPAGLFVIRDELTGWLAELDRSGREGERAFYLSAWSGDTSHTIDRIGRGSIYVPACCLSMLGGIQPERLRSYIAGVKGVPLADDGLIQRFQLAVFPDASAEYKYVDRLPNVTALRRAERMFRRLTDLDAETPLCFRFSPDAQQLFVTWFEVLETRLRGDNLASPMLSHLSKYRSLMPSLALLFELADLASSGGFVGSVGFFRPPHLVSLKNTERAIYLCYYLETHAARIYGCAENVGAKELARRIARGELGRDFTPRQVVQKGWIGLSLTNNVIEACDFLCKAGWLRRHKREPGSSGGRPSLRYEVNPTVWNG